VPFTTAHTGTLHGGTALNIVPDVCTLDFEFRSIAADSLDALTEEVLAYARAALEPEMRAVAPESGIEFTYGSGFPGLDTAPEAEVVALAKQLAGRNAHGKVAYGTEAGLYHNAGVPTVVIGPGSIDQAHKADEFVAVSELEKCGAFLSRLVAHCAA
jgi:acetylornithine deacetylase